ncbi:MAE_28990/MAE_18760 family HEPN-like nuclease [Burkholderia ambifaria]|uniref:MAE_28990/MAE_18760 family HEPN-like nuclease n=1 Tax=Burkholderia ambifaria TaxID=152480 RepID=UPI00158A54D6|nr:MAE_28990/MAE_18760 family HEPN-like nuclease [Burkholderia ambifaria]
MSARTVEEFQTKIARELAWRKREITSLRLSARRSDSERSYLFRAGLVLLCAHWEGFLRKSIEIYFDHVFSQKLKVRELTPNFVAAAFFADVQRAGKTDYPGSLETHGRLARRILMGLDEICTRSTWDAKTEGNPGTEVLARLLSSAGINPQLGLDAATWSTTKVFIDEQVVRDRHLVAHGEGFRITRSEFLERSKRILDLLDRISNEFINAAEIQAYKAAA